MSFDLVGARRKVETALRALQAAEGAAVMPEGEAPTPEVIRWKVGLEVSRETVSRVLHEMFTHREAPPARRRRGGETSEADDPLPATGLPSRPPRDMHDPDTGDQVTDALGNPVVTDALGNPVTPTTLVPPVRPVARPIPGTNYTPPAPTPERLAAARAGVAATPAGRTVREHQTHGACRVLGPYVSETVTSFTYRREDGRAVSVRRSAARRSAGSARPNPHVEPCRSCPDYTGADATFGPGRCTIHGNALPCTTCMET